MNTTNRPRPFDHIAEFCVNRIRNDEKFKVFDYYYWTQSTRLRVLELLDDPENFVPNESVSKEVYEKRYHVLRVLSAPEDPDFDGDYTRVPISPGVFRIAKEIEPVPLVWRD